MGAAMQLYAGFALLVIAIVAIIVLAALISNLIGAVRRRFGRTRRVAGTRAHDDFSKPAAPSRPAAPTLHSKDPPASR
jgi:peptidoglycan/LPS O-acetylase OafA/YrhL